MHKPLPPTFQNQRARLEEHDGMLTAAKRKYPRKPICPDCYEPPALCVHRPPPGTDLPFGVNLG